MTDSLRELVQKQLEPAFRITSEMAGGGMSRLFLAMDEALNRRVVVKVLPPELSTRTSIARFQHEIDLTVQLQHPHIVPILTAGGVGNVLYYISPFIPGESLRARIERDGALPIAEIRRILSQLGAALVYAHARGIVHRDVKPGNILLLDGNAILADFGVARALNRIETLTTDTHLGTPAYLAPEHPRDETADLYAMCVVGWEMLTGSRPPAGVKARDAIRARDRLTPGIAGESRRDSRIFAAILEKGLAAQARDRFESAASLTAALDSWTPPATPTHHRYVRRAARGFGGLLGLTVAVFAGRSAFGDSADRRLERAIMLLSRWDMVESQRVLRDLIEERPVNAHAQLAFARLALYALDDSLRDMGRTSAQQAVIHATQLDSSQREFASALALFFQDSFPAACAAFEKLTRTDRAGFDTWFGLAECLRRDVLVEPAPDIGSGYRFRTGFSGAASAYERSITMIPPPHPSFPYRRMAQVLPIETNRLRAGRARDGTTFLAYPELVGDTLGFTPVGTDALGGSALAVPATRMAALEQNMFRLRRAYATWVRMSSQSADAHAAFAQILEVMGDIAESGPEDVTALSEVRRARALARDTVVAFVAMHVRLLIKDDSIAAARALADSALVRWPDPDVGDAPFVVGLAALAGRVQTVSRLLRDLSATPRYAPRLHGTPLVLPPDVRRARADLMALAALGACTGDVRTLAATVANAVQLNFVDSAQRSQVRDALLARPFGLAVPCAGPGIVGSLSDRSDLAVRLARAFHEHGKPGLTAALDSIEQARRYGRQGDVTLDQGLVEAWLLAAAGDTSASLLRVDRALAGLPLVTPASMSELAVVAALVRLWVLGAKLAAAQGDTGRAAQWASNALAAWGDAEEPLQPAVHEMRMFAAQPGQSSAVGARLMGTDTSRGGNGRGTGRTR